MYKCQLQLNRDPRAVRSYFKEKKLNITSLDEEVDPLAAYDDDDDDDAYTRRMKAEARARGASTTLTSHPPSTACY